MKELLKSVETPEEKRARRLAKKVCGIETSVGKHSYILNLRVKVTTSSITG